MCTAVEEITKIVQKQPADSTYDEILRELTFARMIEKGLNDSRTGKLISDGEMKKRIRSWRR